MSAATPLFSPTLESVQKAFDHWRATRGNRTQTPVNLQRRAAALCGTHRNSHICSALKINDSALKRWAAQLAPASDLAPLEHAAFVALPTLPPVDSIAPSDDTAYPISIDRGDSLALRVHGSFTLEQILCAIGQHQQGAST